MTNQVRELQRTHHLVLVLVGASVPEPMPNKQSTLLAARFARSAWQLGGSDYTQ